ncbi:MAG: histidine kinase, partial [Bacteroidota bacterium]
IKEDYFYEDRDQTARDLADQKAANQALQINKLEADFNALKAQMNPHFIFNSLNSLKALIQEQQTQEAIDYLVKFSALVRVALEKADQPLITLEEEVDFCKNYLAIEALRMPDLDYQIDIEDGLDLSFLEIPPFILQPFLENALRHGLALQEGPRRLHFAIQYYEEGIQCIVDDSGVGRERAKQLKSLTKTERKRSLGMQNIQDRLDMHHQIYQHCIEFKLIDKKNDAGEATGTRVDLFIPD